MVVLPDGKDISTAVLLLSACVMVGVNGVDTSRDGFMVDSDVICVELTGSVYINIQYIVYHSNVL